MFCASLPFIFCAISLRPTNLRYLRLCSVGYFIHAINGSSHGCIFKTTNTTCTTNTTWTANNQGWRYEKGSLVFTAESISRNYECFRGNIKELPICNLLVCLNNNFLRKKLIQNNTIFRNNHYICIRVGAA